MESWIILYFSIGAIVGIPLGRMYWINFRMSTHKANIVLPLRIQNRIVDSFVFMIAWLCYIPLYPLAIVELMIKKIKNKKEATK